MRTPSLQNIPRVLVSALVVIGIASAFNVAHAAQITPNTAPRSEAATIASNELLVKVKISAKVHVKESKTGDTGINALDKLFEAKNAKAFVKLAKESKKSKDTDDLLRWYKVTLYGDDHKLKGSVDKHGHIQSTDPSGADLNKFIHNLKADPLVETVEPSYMASAQTVPNDPYYISSGGWGQSFPDLWGVQKINPEGAWSQTTGSASIVVANVDTGVDRNHPDLAGNMWVNAGEIPGNGIDDDSNGYKDDYHGYNWVKSTNDPMDDNGHGTHTAGTIAAKGNNGQGVVGVNWTSKIMALKFLDDGGNGTIYHAALALQYAADMGARVSSNSWGCSCQSSMIDDAIRYEHDRNVSVVTAAGNSNVDAFDFSPASSKQAITVAATDYTDQKASFSNWGEKVDVAAPGVDILSLHAAGTDMYNDNNHYVPTGNSSSLYYRASGTSMATPHVAGLAALLLAKNPSLTNEQVRQLLRAGSTDLGAPGKDSSFGYGRIDASKTMALSSSSPLAPMITSAHNGDFMRGEIRGMVPGANFASYRVEVGQGRSPADWILVHESGTQVTEPGLLATFNTDVLTEGASYTIRLTATDISGKTYQFSVYDQLVQTLVTQIMDPVQELGNGVVTVTGSAYAIEENRFTQYTLEWADAPTDGSQPTIWHTTGITLSNGGTQPVRNAQLGTWDTTELPGDKSYMLRLTATRDDGRTSQNTATVPKLGPDVAPPYVSIFSPTNGTVIEGSVTIGVAASDRSGIDRVEFYVDDLLLTTDVAAPYNAPLHTTTLPNGTHTLLTRAYDMLGNTADSNTVTITVSNMSPTISLTSPSNGSVLSGTVSVVAAANDNIGVTKVEFYVDGALSATSTATPYGFSWNTRSYADNSTHMLVAKAYDAAGNVTSSATHSVTVKDTTLPTLQITSPADGSLVTRNATTTFTASASDISGVAKVEFYVNGALKCTDTNSPYSCAWLVPNRRGVTYTLTVKAYDVAGNIATSTVQFASK